MQFSFSDEQKMIREMVETMCHDMCDHSTLAGLLESGDILHQRAWETVCSELNLSGVAVPEELGGAGLGCLELASICEMMGQVLLPTPFFSSIVMSATALTSSQNHSLRDRWLPELLSGEKIAAVAYLTQNGGSSVRSESPIKINQGKLSGEFGFVQYGHLTNLFLVHVITGDETTALYAINADAPGIVVEPVTSMDLTRPLAKVTLSDIELGDEDLVSDDAETIEKMFDTARICLASEQLGAAEAVLKMTASYTIERHQFGRAVASFQAVKHRMADMMVLNEAAKSAAWYAACTADQMPDQLKEAAATAMIVTSRALNRNAANMIQLHGGMGFTWECAAHLYFKRAATSSKLLGSSEQDREYLASLALGEVS